MITVDCRHGSTKPDEPEYRRPEPVRRHDRTVAVFLSRHTVIPDLRRDPPQPPERGRWELDRAGAEGTAVRGRRGTWTLRCPRCGRNLPIPERELFWLFDVEHWGPSAPPPGRPVIRTSRGWDTTLDLAAMIRARA